MLYTMTLNFEFDEEHTYFQVTLPIHEASQKNGIENILTPPSHPPKLEIC